jgi:hypothetical protein
VAVPAVTAGYGGAASGYDRLSEVERVAEKRPTKGVSAMRNGIAYIQIIRNRVRYFIRTF